MTMEKLLSDADLTGNERSGITQVQTNKQFKEGFLKFELQWSVVHCLGMNL